jgi:hypothetical protein
MMDEFCKMERGFSSTSEYALINKLINACTYPNKEKFSDAVRGQKLRKWVGELLDEMEGNFWELFQGNHQNKIQNQEEDDFT